MHDPLVIDCDTCRARGIGCGDCMVTVLLGGPPLGVTLNEEERRAVDVLSAAGLIPPLRLVHGVATDVDRKSVSRCARRRCGRWDRSDLSDT